MIENCEKYKKFIKACGVGSRDKVADTKENVFVVLE